MKYYALSFLFILCFLCLGSVVMEYPHSYPFLDQVVSDHTESIDRVGNDIKIYTIQSYELEKELKQLLEIHEKTAYLTEHKDATCTIYQIADGQLQITISPNGDGLGVDLEAENILNCNEELVSCCLDWLDAEQTNCLTLRNISGYYQAFTEDC